MAILLYFLAAAHSQFFRVNNVRINPPQADKISEKRIVYYYVGQMNNYVSEVLY